MDFADDVKARVILLTCFDLHAPNMNEYFETNLQCRKSKLDVELCMNELAEKLMLWLLSQKLHTVRVSQNGGLLQNGGTYSPF